MGTRQSQQSPWLTRAWRRFIGLFRLSGFGRLGESDTKIAPERRDVSRGLLPEPVVGWPSAASPERITALAVDPDLTSPGPPSDPAEAGGAQPSTSDEDATVHSNGSFDGDREVSPTSLGTGTGFASGVSRETSDTPTLMGGGGLVEVAGAAGRPEFGFGLAAASPAGTDRPSAVPPPGAGQPVAAP